MNTRQVGDDLDDLDGFLKGARLRGAPRLARAVSGFGVRGGAAPRQPPQGTHGVWPQGVSWLDALSLRQASPAGALESARNRCRADGRRRQWPEGDGRGLAYGRDLYALAASQCRSKMSASEGCAIGVRRPDGHDACPERLCRNF